MRIPSWHRLFRFFSWFVGAHHPHPRRRWMARSTVAAVAGVAALVLQSVGSALVRCRGCDAPERLRRLHGHALRRVECEAAETMAVHRPDELRRLAMPGIPQQHDVLGRGSAPSGQSRQCRRHRHPPGGHHRLEHLQPLGVQPDGQGARDARPHRDRRPELDQLRRLGLRSELLQRGQHGIVRQLRCRPRREDHPGRSTTTDLDSGQVLNGGGVDSGHCVNGGFVSGRIDESHPWVQIGTAAAAAPTSPQSLAACRGRRLGEPVVGPPTSDGGSPITGYSIYRGTSAGGESATPIATNVKTSTYADTGRVNGTRVLLHRCGRERRRHVAAVERGVRDASVHATDSAHGSHRLAVVGATRP